MGGVDPIDDAAADVQPFSEVVYEFWFQNEENRDVFAADPWSYAPAYGGYCSFGLATEFAVGGFGPYGDPFCPPGSPFSWYVDDSSEEASRLFIFNDDYAKGYWLSNRE